MPKHSRCRRVCAEPAFRNFHPSCSHNAAPVALLVDEFEAIRLVDFHKMTHEQCAKQMQISRTTVTEIYEKARFKIADALVNGKSILITGGNYRICENDNNDCCRGQCQRRNFQSARNFVEGEKIMKIAIPVKHENIYQHFGMASTFKVYTVENNQIVKTESIATEGRGHGAMLSVLLENGINCVICGGIGEGAIQGVTQAGIELVAGISGTADDALNAYLAGGLQSNMQQACSKQHHSHQHGHCECAHEGCSGQDHHCHCGQK